MVVFADFPVGYLGRCPNHQKEEADMRIPWALPVTAASLALATGLSVGTATAAGAATTSPARGGPVPASSASVLGTVTAPVTGSFTNAAGTGTFTGSFRPQKFSLANGVLEATGRLTGTLTSADGTQLGRVNQVVTLPVSTTANAASATNAPAVCGILNLVLGPLNLNLLGLVVTLNQVHLTITAVPGAGNLLGNLLCAVANLLNGGGGLSALSALLNNILALL